MYRLKFMPSACIQRQRGVTLLESLIAIIVAALGILGVLGVQMRTLTDTQTAVRRAQAVRLIEDLQERMRVNPNSLTMISSYVSGWGSPPGMGTNCRSVACTPAQLVAFDVSEWKTAVQRNLPLGQASIFLAPSDTVAADRRLLGVMISWRENEFFNITSSDKDAINATLDSSASGGIGTSAANACPPNRTCHLQYISVSARCAPYHPAGNMAAPVQFHCSGV